MKQASDVIDRLKERDLYELTKKVAHKFGMTVAEVVAPERQQDRIYARAVLFGVLYARGHWSTTRLGELFGCDHTVVLYGLRKASKADVQAIEPPVSP